MLALVKVDEKITVKLTIEKTDEDWYCVHVEDDDGECAMCCARNLDDALRSAACSVSALARVA